MSTLPLEFSKWTEDQLAKLPFFELLVLALNGEATLHPGGVNATKRLFQGLELTSNDYVLEIGCGSGKDLCILVAKYGCRAVGIEYSDFLVKFATNSVQEAGLNSKISIMKGDVTNLDFGNEQFDLVFAQSVLATVAEKDKAAIEISRVLKPGGRFGDIEFTWLHEPDYDLVRNVEQRTGGSFDRPLTSEQWVELFSKIGFNMTQTFTSTEFGFPTGLLGFIKQEGFIRSTKVLRLMFTREKRVHLRQRSEHVRWMIESGKIGYGIYVFKKP